MILAAEPLLYNQLAVVGLQLFYLLEVFGLKLVDLPGVSFLESLEGVSRVALRWLEGPLARKKQLSIAIVQPSL